MDALLNPIDRTGRGIKWGLVAHTLAMFSVATITIGTGLNLQSHAYIDNREFFSSNGSVPGPYGYKQLVYTKPISLIPNNMFQVNQWLADGLLVSFTLSPVEKILIYVSSTAVISFIP